MKKTLFILAAMLLIFFSCKKNGTSPAGKGVKKYKVTLNVTNFKSSMRNFALRHNANNLASADTISNLNTYLDLLNFSIVDNFNDFTNFVQDSTNAQMGMFVDSLPPGKYTIIAAGGKKGLVYNGSRTGNFSYGGQPWQDTFYGNFTITVGNGDLTQDVTLRRVVAKLEVTILDNIPANADSIIVSTPSEANAMDIASGIYMFSGHINARFPVAIPASAKGKPNFTIERIIGNCAEQIPVIITCKGPGNTIIATTTVNNVNTTQNRRTILSGNLFGSVPVQGSQTFTVKVDTTWGGSSTESF